MNFTKMSLIPFESQIENNRGLIEFILKLGKINAYNEELYMQINKKYDKKVNIIEYILALSDKDKQLKYEDEFVNHIKKANINPEIIQNKSIKDKLINKRQLYTKVNPIHKKLKWETIK